MNSSKFYDNLSLFLQVLLDIVHTIHRLTISHLTMTFLLANFNTVALFRFNCLHCLQDRCCSNTDTYSLLEKWIHYLGEQKKGEGDGIGSPVSMWHTMKRHLAEYQRPIVYVQYMGFLLGVCLADMDIRTIDQRALGKSRRCRAA